MGEGQSYRQRADSFLLQEPTPPLAERRGGSRARLAGERQRTEDGVTRVQSVIYFFIIKTRAGS